MPSTNMLEDIAKQYLVELIRLAKPSSDAKEYKYVHKELLHTMKEGGLEPFDLETSWEYIQALRQTCEDKWRKRQERCKRDVDGCIDDLRLDPALRNSLFAIMQRRMREGELSYDDLDRSLTNEEREEFERYRRTTKSLS